VAQAYALARAAFTAEDLQRYTEVDEGIPVEQVITELEDLQRRTDPKAQSRSWKLQSLCTPGIRTGLPPAGRAGMKQVLTVGDVAAVAQVIPRVVCQWFDSGQLSGYRLPNTQERRILREALVRFLMARSAPAPNPEELDRQIEETLRRSAERRLQAVLAAASSGQG
jgi:hypothetical protein